MEVTASPDGFFKASNGRAKLVHWLHVIRALQAIRTNNPESLLSVKYLLTESERLTVQPHEAAVIALQRFWRNGRQGLLAFKERVGYLIASHGTEDEMRNALNGGLGDMPGAAACDLQDPSGLQRSMIHYAAGQGNSSTLGVLLEFGAQLDAVDQKGASALHYAVTPISIIQDAQQQQSKESWKASFKSESIVESKLDCIEMLLEAGCDVDRADFSGETPLHYSVKRGLHQAVLSRSCFC